MSDNYDEIYKNLSSQVSEITEKGKTMSYLEMTKINKKQVVAFGIMLLIISIILLVWKPKFIMDVKFGGKNREINYSKFLVAMLVLSVICTTISIYVKKWTGFNFF